MHGMTGHGSAQAQDPSLKVAVEIRTVNHRNLDIDIRSTRLPADLDVAVKGSVRRVLARGKVEVSIQLEINGSEAMELRVNESLLRGHVDALRKVASAMGLAGEVSVDHLSMLPWNRAFELPDVTLSEEQGQLVLATVDRALTATVSLRAREGEEVGADLRARLATLGSLHARVAAESSTVTRARRDRLVQRLAELALEVEVEPGRVAQEIVVLADRCDIAEELTRLEAYLQRLAELLDGKEPVGKKIDFTLQEALREVNTIGSKARDLTIGTAVIDMKTELERMREQTANVE